MSKEEITRALGTADEAKKRLIEMIRDMELARENLPTATSAIQDAKSELNKCSSLAESLASSLESFLYDQSAVTRSARIAVCIEKQVCSPAQIAPFSTILEDLEKLRMTLADAENRISSRSGRPRNEYLYMYIRSIYASYTAFHDPDATLSDKASSGFFKTVDEILSFAGVEIGDLSYAIRQSFPNSFS